MVVTDKDYFGANRTEVDLDVCEFPHGLVTLPLSTNIAPLKINDWKMIRSFWGGVCCSHTEREDRWRWNPEKPNRKGDV